MSRARLIRSVLALLFVVPFVGGGLCGPSGPSGPPDPDTCSDPAASLEVTSIELVDAMDASRFLSDGSSWTRVAGGQGGGATMSGLVLRLHLAAGAAPVSCVRQRTSLVGQQDFSDNLRMTDVGGGVIQSSAYWFVFPDNPSNIQVEAYGQTLLLTGVRSIFPWEEDAGM